MLDVCISFAIACVCVCHGYRLCVVFDVLVYRLRAADVSLVFRKAVARALLVLCIRVLIACLVGMLCTLCVCVCVVWASVVCLPLCVVFLNALFVHCVVLGNVHGFRRLGQDARSTFTSIRHLILLTSQVLIDNPLWGSIGGSIGAL